MAQGDGFLFSGNRHDAVPRRLFLDKRLTPLERNAWQIIRLHLDEDGATAFPSYERLRPYLAMTPCGAKASFETIARVLTLLRLTRWLSLICRQRDPKTGRKLGNLYVLHDEPLTPFEAMQLDAEYLELLCQSLGHASTAVRRVGQHVLQELADDPAIQTRLLPTRVQMLTQRLAGSLDVPGYPPQADTPDSEVGGFTPPDSEAGLATESETGAKPASILELRKPKSDSTVSSKYIYKVPTTNTAHTLVDRETDPPSDPTPALQWPERFQSLRPTQQTGIKTALEPLDAATGQILLNEWDARCRKSRIRNPAGYLFGIIQKAFRGEFNAWAAEPEPAQPATATPAPTSASAPTAASTLTPASSSTPATPPESNKVLTLQADGPVIEGYLSQMRSMVCQPPPIRRQGTAATQKTPHHPANSRPP